ncbi:uncharacterized protein [Aegilops tauschii subsp. strangulata]|uniref:uncharacterized protein n=1 Tax=Aegilops tauschii subsp. strangulata TaxID=200361 RepID=UPI001ABC9F73|nr:uncharacterized protein LOC120968853 [Aegilops tauschii subsp. strangulata]
MVGCRLSRVLMDGGSGLDIIFTNTLEKMKISPSSLRTSNVGFHGVVPGHPVRPLGRIELEGVFRDGRIYRIKAIQFEVAPFQSSYHVISGRLAYVKFMVIPSYAYLHLKMPSPNGTITVRGRG